MKAKTRVLLLALGVAMLAAAYPAYAAVRRFTLSTGSSSPFSGSVPSTACNFSSSSSGVASSTGLNLAGLRYYYVCVQAAFGQTLSGGGSIQMYFYDPDLAIWAYESAADEAIPAAASGARTYCFPARSFQSGPQSTGGYGCVYPVPSSVTANGGATIRTTVTGVF